MSFPATRAESVTTTTHTSSDRTVELRWDRDEVWIEHQGHTVAGYERSYEHGVWLPAPRMRPEPPHVAPVIPITGPQVVPPALTDYAELCA